MLYVSRKIFSSRKLLAMVLPLVIAYGLPAYATTGITLQGRILNPDGSAVTSNNVQFKIQIKSPGNEDCLLYEEIQAVDMTNTSGGYALTVGNGARSAAAIDGGYPLSRIFANHGLMDFSATTPSACQIGPNYTPGVADGRKLVYSFNDGSGWQSVPAMAINWVPLALESLQVGGFNSSNLLRVDNAGVPGAAAPLTSANFTELMALIMGTTTQYVKPGSAVFTAAPQYSGAVTGVNDLANKAYVDSAITAGIPNVGTAGTYYQVTTDAKGRVISGQVSLVAADIPNLDAAKITTGTFTEAQIPTLTTAGKVSGTAITSGAISGTTSINSSGNIVTSGTVSANLVSGNAIRVYNGAVNYVEMTAPVMGAPVSFVLPGVDGTVGQVLKTDGAGHFGWMNPSAGSVTSVTSGGAPIVIGGTAAAPTVSINLADTSTNGYLSSADWNTFNNKVSTALPSANIWVGTAGGVAAPVAPSGDVSLTNAGAFTVNKIKNTGIDFTVAPANGNFLKFNGTDWLAANLSTGDIGSGILPVVRGGTGLSSFGNNSVIVSNGTGTGLASLNCAIGQVIKYDASGYAGCAADNDTTPGDATYAAKGVVEFLTDAATSGITVAAGVANVNSGTGANQIVKLDGSAKLPAVDGSALTNLSAGNISSGVLPIARGGTNSGTALNNDRMVVSSGGALVETAALTNGQILLGSTAAAPVVATLGSSNGIVLTPGAGSLSVATNATPNNTVSTIVSRDASGNFAASNITNTANLLKGATAGNLTMTVPATVTSYTLTWPAAVGSAGNFLTTDASGNLSWGSPAAIADSSYAAKGAVQFLTDAATSGITVASGVANVNSGTGANQIVKLDGTAKLPAVDGSALTNLNAGNLASGIVPVVRGGTGQSTYTDGQLLIGNSTGNTLTKTSLGASNGIVLTPGSGSLSVATNATSANTVSTIVSRDASGNFAASAVTNTSNLLKGATAGNLTMTVPATVTSYTLTWPAAVGGAGNFLTTDASGNLSWGSPAAIPDSSYAVKGAVEFLTDAATSGITVAAGVANVNTGTGANQIVKLDGTAKLPAVDGSALTNLSAGNISSGVLPIARGGTNSGTALNNDRMMVSSGGAIVETAALTNGQILLGSTGAAPVVATLGSSNGIALTSGAGSLSIATNATPNNTVSTIVSRDASGNFAASAVTNTSNLLKGATAGNLTMTVPATVTSYTLTWPAAVGGAGNFLTTDASGNLSWGSPAAIADSSYTVKGAVQFLTDAATSGITVAAGVANVNAGTGANQIVKLDGTAKLPAVDGSALTNLNAGNLASGIVPVVRGGTGQSTYTDGQLLIGNSTGNTLTKTSLGASNGIVLTPGAGSLSVATNATSANTVSTIVSRDASGNFAASSITNTANLLKGATAGNLTMTVPATVTSYTLTWPAAVGGAGNFLTTDASGNLSWGSPAAIADSSYTVKGAVQFLTDAATSGITVASGVANVNSGTGANQIVKLDGTAKLPAVDGSALTNLNAGNISSGVLPIARGGTNSGTALNNNRMVVSSGGALVETAALTNGQILLGSTAAAPVVATLGASNGIVLTPGAGSLSVATNATSANTVSTIVSRDASGNFAASAVTNTSNLLKGATAGNLTMTVPATVTSYTLTWPAAVGGAGNFLTTDASGNLSWGSPAAISDSSYTVKGAVQFLTDAATSGITVAAGVANVNAGTGANQIVKLDGTAKLPAVDGSALTNLNAGNLASGIVPVVRGGTGQSTYTDGQLLIGNSTGNTLTKTSLGASNGIVLTPGAGSLSVATNATSANTVSTIVSRDAAGNFAASAVTNTANLLKGATAGNLTMTVPATVTSYTLTWPAAVGGAGNFLTTDASGNLSWGSPAAISDSSYTVKGAVQFLTDAATSGITVASGVANVNSGTGANQIVKLDGTAKLPAVDGSALTNLNAGNISSGVLPIARGGTNSGTALNNNRMVVSSGGALVETAALTNGQILLGSTAAAPVVATLGASNGIVLTPGAGSLSVATNATSANTVSTIVSRDASGNFAASAVTNTSNLLKGATAGNLTMTVPATVTSYTLTWPAAVGGAGNFLTTDASGNLSWGSPAAISDSSYTVKGAVQFLTDAATSGITVAAGVANVNAGTGANQIVKLDGTAKLPAVDGSALTNLNAGNLASGIVPVVRGGTGQSTYTDGQLLIGNSTGNTLTKTSLGASNGIVLTPGAGSLSVATNATSANTVSTIVSRDAAGNFAASAVTNTANLLKGATAGNLTMTVPATVTSYTLTWPAAVGGAGNFLTTDASGNLSWGSPAAISDSSYTVKGAVQFLTDAATSGITVASGVANVNSGTGANQIVKLDGTAKLPAVDGSALTNLNAGNISSGVLPIARGGTNSGTALNNNRMVVSSGGALVETAALTNGQILLGSTAAAPVVATLGASNGIVLTPGAGSLSVATNATSANTVSTIVSRDATGNFAASAVTNTSNLLKGATAGNLTMTVPATVTSYTLTWPAAVGGAGAFLTTDASGNLSWGSPAAISDSSYTVKGAVQFLTDAATSGITVAAGVANVNAGTGANQIVKLDGTAKLPAVDGSALTNLNAGNLASGIVPVVRGGTGQSTYTDGQLLIGNSTGNTLTKTSLGASNGIVLTPGAGSLSVATNATSANTVSTIVSRDAAGNFAASAVTNTANLLKGATAGNLTMTVPATVTSYTLTWPAAVGGAGNFLTTDASGNLSWGSPAAISDSSYTVKGAVQFLTDAATSGITVASGVANVNSGTGANQIVKLDGTAKLPAVDGSALTNLNAGNISSGVLPIARGGTNSGTALNNNRMVVSSGGALVETAALTNGQILLGSTAAAPVVATLGASNGIVLTPGAGSLSVATNATSANTVSTIVSRDASGNFAASAVTNTSNLLKGATAGNLTMTVPATVTSYTLTWPAAVGGAGNFLTTDASGNLSWGSPAAISDSSYTVKGAVQFLTDAATSGITVAAGVANVNSGTGANQIVKLDGTAKLPAVDGSALTNLNAGNISSGVLPIARGGTNSGTALNNNRIVVTSGGAHVETAALTNGQILLGSTGAAPVVATLGASNGIVLTPGAGSLSVATNATSANTVSTIVSRDASGNFAASAVTNTSNLLKGATAGNLTMTVPATVTSYTLTWPAAVGGAGAFLTTDASGNLSWGSPAAISDSSYTVKGAVQFLTDAATSGITVAAGVANVNTGTGANQIVKLDGTAKLPAVDGSALTNLNAGNISSGVLPIARGGTNNGTLAITAGGMVYMDGTKEMTSAAGTAGQAMISAGAGVPAFGTLGVIGGGTGQTTYTDGQLLIGNSTGNTLTKTSLGASNGIVLTPGAGSLSVATNATSANTVSTIVSRDASGNFAASSITNTANLLKGATAGQLTMTVPATVTSYTLTWPAAVGGAGAFLTTDASGNLSWGSPAAISDSSYTVKGAVQFLTDAATSGITVAAGVANVNSGTGANQIVKLDGTAKLPAVDGSALTNLNAGNISSGVLPIARGGTNSGTALNNNRIVVTSGGAHVETAALTNGQILLGSTGAAPVVATLGASNGIVLTPGAGSLSVATNATSANTVSTIVSRDASGNFAASAVTNTSNLLKGATAGNLTMTVPATVTSYTLTWPAAVGGAGAFLTTDASGNLSWGSPAAISDSSYTVKGAVQFLTDAATSGITVASGVANVNTGTAANQIVKLDGTAKLPAVDGSALTNLNAGNISSGVLPIARGGTNNGTLAITAGGMVYMDGTKEMTSAAGTSGQAMISNGAGVPAFGTLGVAGGGTGLSTTTINQLLYSSAANTISGLATVNNATLTTNGSGVPTWATNATDTFTQYALLAGRASGQVLKGGTAASENLTLDSTAHATKGYVLLNPTGGNVGVGNAAPAAKLDVTDVANTIALQSTGYSLTGANAQSLMNLAGTWNTTGIPTLIKANVVDTASNAASLLMDLQVGGTSKFSVDKTGKITGDGSGLTGVPASSNSFIQNGNSFGTVANLGTNDNFDLNFETNNTTRMSILAAGNVGIGSATPANILDIARSSNAIETVRLTNINVGASAQATYTATSNAGSLTTGINSTAKDSGRAFVWNQGNTGMEFATNNTVRMYIESSGNVGIGTLVAVPTAGLQNSIAGIASTPGERLDGAWFTGGTATNTKPQLLVEPAAATSTGWATTGTGLGVNAAAGFTGNLIDAQLNGVSKFKVDYTGKVFGDGSGLTGVVAGALPLNSITAASNTNTIDSLTFAQTWNWSTATTQNPMSLSAAALTTGSLMSLSGNALTTGSILNVTTSSGVLNSTNGLLNVANTSAVTNGVVARIQSNSTAGSGMTVLANGNVGIGTTTPAGRLEIRYDADLSGWNGNLLINNQSALSSAEAKVAFASDTGTANRSVITKNSTANISFSGSGSFNIGNVGNEPFGIITNSIPRLYVAGNGNVSIGTTAPGAQLDITPTVNTIGLQSMGQSLTGANAQSLMNLAGTWNTTGTPTLIKANVVDTASNVASLLMDLQVGGVSKFKVDKTGKVTGDGSGLTGVPATFSGLTTKGIPYATSATTLSTADAANFSWDYTNHRLGIGTATPAGILDIQGGTAAAATAGTNININAQNGGTGTTNGGGINFKAGAKGSVGGNYGDIQFLDAGTVYIQPSSGTNGTGNLYVGSTNADATGGANIMLSSRPTGGGFPTTAFAGLGSIGFQSEAGAWITSAKMLASASENQAAGARGTELSFWTTPNTTATLTQRMTIANDGNVGIGTTSPGFPLELIKTSNLTAGEHLLIKSETLSTGSGVGIGYYSNGAAVTGGLIRSTYNAMPLFLGTNTTKQAVTILDATGNVGIGTVTPGAQLDVTPTANTIGLQSTGQSLTGANAQSLVNLSGTWNTTGIPTLIKANVVDTASNVASLLMDLQVGGVSKFKVDKTGKVTGDGSGLTGVVAGALPLSSITAATASPAALANANFAQTWNWDTLTTQNAMSMGSTSMTSGSLLTLSDTFNSATSTGNVLKLNVTGASSLAVPLAIVNGGSGLSIDVNDSGTGTSNMMRLFNSIAAANNSGSQITFSANRTTGGVTDVSGVSGLITDITNGAYKGALVFSTANNAAPAERMRIDNAGNVGIGTTTPAGTLDVQGGTATNANGTPINIYAQSGNGTNKNGGNIILMPGAQTGTGIIGGVGIGTASPAYILDMYAAGWVDTRVNNGTGMLQTTVESTSSTVRLNAVAYPLIFQTNNVDRMTFTQAGNIGIGTATPTAGLQNNIAGVASVPGEKLSGAWYIAGTATTSKPQLLIEPAGAVTTGWSAVGTGLGVNAAAGFAGNLIDAQLNGVSKFKVDSTGKVTGDGSGLTGIAGTVSGLTTGAIPKAASATTLTNSVMTESGGSIGIGTSSPGSTLTVNGNTTVYNTGVASDVLLEAQHYSANAGNSGAVQFYRARGTKAAPTQPLAGDIMGNVRALNAVSPNSWPGMYFSTTENHSPTAQGMAINFQTTGNGTVGGTERMRIDQNGNVGIGTNVPNTNLEVVANSASSPIRISRTNNTTQWSTLGLFPTGALSGANPSWYTGINANAANYTIGSYDGSTSTDRMTVTTAGNVGIGTATPTSTLVVNGAARNDSAITNTAGPIDFTTSNLQFTTNSCNTGTGAGNAFKLYNLKSGGSYTFAVQGATSATCSFLAYSDGGTTALTVHMPTDHAASTASKHTLYNFIVMGTHVYVAWNPGL